MTDNTCMSILSTPTTELQEAAERAAKGIRDPEAMRKASERLDALRAALEKRVGIVQENFIRELRDA